MNKRKTKSIIDLICILLVILPIIFCIISIFMGVRNADFDFNETFLEISNTCVMSKRLRERVYNVLNSLGIFWYGANLSAFEYMVSVVVSNSLVIYMCRIFIGVLVWLPKFFSKLLERWCDI